MSKYMIIIAALCYFVIAERPVQGVKSTDESSSSDHTSFSFIRPGLTQTSFAFSGPSSHQSFASSIGNPQLAQKVLPNLAQALAYRNPGLGYYSITPAANENGITSNFATPAVGPFTYQAVMDPATALAYAQQQQAYLYGHQSNALHQAQLAQLLALRQMQAPVQPEQLQAIQPQQQQQEEQPKRQTQSLLGVAYSSAPSVAHVKVSGNGYKFDF